MKCATIFHLSRLYPKFKPFHFSARGVIQYLRLFNLYITRTKQNNLFEGFPFHVFYDLISNHSDAAKSKILPSAFLLFLSFFISFNL